MGSGRVRHARFIRAENSISFSHNLKTEDRIDTSKIDEVDSVYFGATLY